MGSPYDPLAWVVLDIEGTTSPTSAIGNGEFFPDVAPALRAWQAAGLRLAVFSSGSVTSQRTRFADAPDGDLSTLIQAWFDTVNAGPKLDRVAYAKIAAALGVPAGRILFLSGTDAELAAAAAAGWRTAGIARPGEPGATRGLPSFADVDPAIVPARLVRSAGVRIAAEAARLAALGWMRGTFGDASVVLSRDPLLIAVSASGLDKATLTAGDIAVVDVAGRQLPVCGAERDPSAEAELHARIAARTGAAAVVHAHAHSPVLAAARWPHGIVLRDLEMLKGLGRAAHDDEVRIPVIANSQDMTELAASFDLSHDPATPVILVSGHGMYAWGASLCEARHVAECADWLLTYALASPGGCYRPARVTSRFEHAERLWPA